MKAPSPSVLFVKASSCVSSAWQLNWVVLLSCAELSLSSPSTREPSGAVRSEVRGNRETAQQTRHGLWMRQIRGIAVEC
ncbi:hypothetical protein F5144DRAFT_574601 [Chaetomium tenue]|uniref:Uncharacterized protein n=1 Tax=Chaetomium tenue TaxID=1854479 RepID=A0ACB7P8G2_9PEZI|nr:hypothetical protein F5144DRAFT_574601 [Chaetomium globosum]